MQSDIMNLEKSDLVGDLISLPADLFSPTPWTTVYERKLSEINTSAKLRDFVTSWRPIWRIPWRTDWKPSTYELQLTTEQYDAADALRCIFMLRDGRSCPHCLDEHGDCPGANIFAPHLIVRCLEIARDAGIPSNKALLGIVHAIVEQYTN